MTSITVGLEDALATRLAEEAERAGMTPEQLAAKALEEFLSVPRPVETGGPELIDPFAFIGMMDSDELRGRSVDQLLAKGFGQSRS